MQFVGVDPVGRRTLRNVCLTPQPQALDVLEGIDQRRQLVACNATALAHDAQPLAGVRIRNAQCKGVDARSIDEGTRAVLLEVDGMWKVLVVVVAEALPPSEW
ncbi:MAG: hypothetical protein AW07_00496 [Candidatus Accumulibacter sp. SK-11]|nr:MAG: hypothetical protein AW07_00496 [Candidatus Accumulibacter sp. SK-11]